MPVGLFCWVSAFESGLIALACHGEETFLCSYLHVSELDQARLPFNKLSPDGNLSSPIILASLFSPELSSVSAKK